ncbi:hypothetical protein DFH06DRAFT_1395020 [Mycena polygramma]|nr:hypothetical protein DFH06DRAFT_1395020 [Mycena polygramma]
MLTTAQSLERLSTYVEGSLTFYPSVVERAGGTGLSTGTIYDVPVINTGIGNVTVHATGFNITCGYLDEIKFRYRSIPDHRQWQTQFREGNSSVNFTLSDTPHGIIVSDSSAGLNPFFKSIVLYSTIPIVDSTGQPGPYTKLVPSMDQQAILDAHSQQLLTVSPTIRKTSSSWVQFTGQEDGPVDNDGVPEFLVASDENSFLDAWGYWYRFMILYTATSLRVPDLYLIEKLALLPANGGTPRHNVTLHELENVLSEIMADMFWTLTYHLPPAPSSRNFTERNGYLIDYPDKISPSPVPLNRTTNINTNIEQAQVNLSILAISAGLLASITLMLLSVPYYRSLISGGYAKAQMEDTKLPGVEEIDDISMPGTKENSSGLVPGSACIAATKKSQLQLPKSLRWFSFLLHFMLVLTHIAVLVILKKGLEHQLTFSLNNQAHLSLIATAVSTTFAAIYCALLVFVTQALSMHQSMRKNQLLTTTHDISEAWAGIGSAFSCIWKQRVLPVSLSGVLSATLYLGCIMVVHITTPALISLETFNTTRSTLIRTQGLPLYAGFNESTADSVLVDNRAYASQSLSSFQTVVQEAEELGLSGGTLYDVLGPNAGIGSSTVDATGFNISCGYMTDLVEKGFDGATWNMEVGTENSFSILPQPRGFITSSFTPPLGPKSSLVLISTIPIIDSQDRLAGLTTLNPPMAVKPSASVQILGCSLSLVHQTGTVDTQSRKIITVEPDIKKTDSSWEPFSIPGYVFSGVPPGIEPTGAGFLINSWAGWYSNLPLISNYSTGSFASPDLFLADRLDLWSANTTSPPRANVTLHELENALSVIVASMFWTLGHQPPPAMLSINVTEVNGTLVRYSDSNQTLSGPILLNGTAAVTEMFPHGRLDLNSIAATTGLIVSIVLLLLSLPYSVSQAAADEDNSIELGGIGLLHAIWLYRNHPELQSLLEQVENPTDEELRSAGLVNCILLPAGGKADQ